MIRKAEPRDISRIAEILVFTKRMKYRSIFHNDEYSFNGLQVVKVADEFWEPKLLGKVWVYDDGIVKGMIHLEGKRSQNYMWITFSGKRASDPGWLNLQKKSMMSGPYGPWRRTKTPSVFTRRMALSSTGKDDWKKVLLNIS